MLLKEGFVKFQIRSHLLLLLIIIRHLFGELFPGRVFAGDGKSDNFRRSCCFLWRENNSDELYSLYKIRTQYTLLPTASQPMPQIVYSVLKSPLELMLSLATHVRSRVAADWSLMPVISQ